MKNGILDILDILKSKAMFAEKLSALDWKTETKTNNMKWNWVPLDSVWWGAMPGKLRRESSSLSNEGHGAFYPRRRRALSAWLASAWGS